MTSQFFSFFGGVFGNGSFGGVGELVFFGICFLVFFGRGEEAKGFAEV